MKYLFYMLLGVAICTTAFLPIEYLQHVLVAIGGFILGWNIYYLIKHLRSR